MMNWSVFEDYSEGEEFAKRQNTLLHKYYIDNRIYIFKNNIHL